MTIRIKTQPGRLFHAPYPRLLSLLRRTLLLMNCVLILTLPLSGGCAFSGDLADVLKAGKLRHLGIPFANFVSNQGDGLDVELMQMFAAHLGVTYEFVPSTRSTIISDLTGKNFRPRGDDVVITGRTAVRGDVIASGFTVLQWRQKIVDFAAATFPTGVWLIARADSILNPITPTGDITRDIEKVKSSLRGRSVLVLKDSCLDPDLYHLGKTGAAIQLLTPDRGLDEMIPMVIGGTADSTLMDVPVALIALEKWPGKIKVVGPVSHQQAMAPAFAKSSPDLKAAFETFFNQCKADGTYNRLVGKYYPTVFTYYPDFFAD